MLLKAQQIPSLIKYNLRLSQAVLLIYVHNYYVIHTLYMLVCMHMSVHARECVHIIVSACICAYMHVCIFVYLYVCVDVYVHVCGVCIWIHYIIHIFCTICTLFIIIYHLLVLYYWPALVLAQGYSGLTVSMKPV